VDVGRVVAARRGERDHVAAEGNTERYTVLLLGYEDDQVTVRWSKFDHRDPKMGVFCKVKR
jgi:hypothetical protein